MSLNAGVSFQPQKSKLSYKKDQLDTVAVRNVFNLLRHLISVINSRKQAS